MMHRAEHKYNLIKALRCVDEVVIGSDLEAPLGLDFQDHFLRLKPQVMITDLIGLTDVIVWSLSAARE
jgi:hypothetical protein